MEPANLLKEPDDPFLVTQPGDILRVLKDIQREQQLLMLALPGGQKILTMLLDVNGSLGHFLYDSGRSGEETQTILSTARIHFSATLRGVSVRFTTPPPMETVFDGAPAFLSPLPLDMHYIQRREHYRTKCIRPYSCSARLTDGTAISLTMRDLSLGGVGLQSNTIPPEMLPVGTLLRDAVLDLLELGKVEVTLLITSHQKIGNGGLSTYLYCCRFEQLPSSKETIVQRLVFSLEQFNRANTLITDRS